MHKKSVQGTGLPKNELGAVTSNMSMGGGGCHPALQKHLQTQAGTTPAGRAVTGVRKPLAPKTTLGGGGCHPAISKHLQHR